MDKGGVIMYWQKIVQYIVHYRPRKLRSRFVLAMISLSVPPLFVLGYISYDVARDTLVQNHTDNNAYHLKTASEVADLLFRNLINMNRLILANDDLRREVRESGMDGHAVINLRTANRLHNVVVNNLVDTRHIESICIFDRDYRSVCYGSTPERAGIYGSDEGRASLADTVWYQKALAAQGKEQFFSYNVLQGTSNGSAFSSVKLLRDPSNYETIGLLVINIKKTLFEQVINEGGDSGFVVFDPSDNHLNIIYDRFPALTSLFLSADTESTFLKQLQKNGYLTTTYTNRTTGWTFLHFVAEKTLLKDSDRIGVATTLIASLIALIALLLSLFLSGTIIRPLLQLKKMMVDWSKGTQSTRESFEEDEVGVIGETFKRITSENVQLNERLIRSQLKEREAELRTLQAQIKPHFLYNTLDSIYWMAVIQKNEDIAKMAVSLSESFKLSLNKGKETIPVFKELKHIEHYMTIQNLRYNERFQYIQEVESSLMGLEILKLMLQPLVENAIYHGLEPKVGEGTIRLSGKLEAGMVVFTVEDDGIGIADLEVTKQGYGLGNVRERLQLYYGPSSSLDISSEPNAGTKITIRFRPEGRREG